MDFSHGLLAVGFFLLFSAKKKAIMNRPIKMVSNFYSIKNSKVKSKMF